MHRIKEMFDIRDERQNLSDFDADYDSYVQSIENYRINPTQDRYIELTCQLDGLYCSMKMLYSNGELSLDEFTAIKEKLFEMRSQARMAAGQR